jgi:hypothetical protein
MSELMTWRRIPSGCKLEVSLTPVPGEFTATGEVFPIGPTNPASQEWSDTDVHPGPKVFTIGSGKDYIVDLVVTFVSAAASEATVNVRVVKPDGTSFGRPRSATLTGRIGDPPDTVSIVLVTQ